MPSALMVSNTSWTSWSNPVRVYSNSNWNVSSSGNIPQNRARRTDALIEPKTGYRLVTDEGNRSFADVLRRIRDLTQLDWGQIARVLGVSRRTVYNWLSGTRVSGLNYKRLYAFQNAVMKELEGVSTIKCRDHLLAPDEKGETPLSRIAGHISEAYSRTVPVLSAVDLLQVPASQEVNIERGSFDENISVPELDSNGMLVVE